MIMTDDTRLRLLEDVSPGAERPFLPGMGKDWLLPLYDPMTRLMGIRRLQRRLIELTDLSDGRRLLDVGCGTGNLLLIAAALVPGAELAGLDPDRRALSRAARKATRSGAALTLVHGYADRLPYPDGSLDRVVSSMALHHLDAASRQGFAAEALRVLRPGGTVTILDFGGAVGDQPGSADHDHRGHRHGIGFRMSAGLRRRGLADERVQQNLDDSLPRLLRDGGFAEAQEIEHLDSWMSPITYVRAVRP